MCTDLFILPQEVKRVLGSEPNFFPKVVSETSVQRFVSIPGGNVIMNHFPLEIVYQHSPKKRYIIKETARFVGKYTFYDNNDIVSVVFPSSVKCIDSYAFQLCKTLRFIHFKRNSKLKKIKKMSFDSARLESIEIPSYVRKIGRNAFSFCQKLRSVTLHEDSKLKIIGKSSFSSTAVESVEIPSSAEKIGASAFSDCENLRSITFRKDSKLRMIDGFCQYITVESVDDQSAVKILLFK